MGSSPQNFNSALIWGAACPRNDVAAAFIDRLVITPVGQIEDVELDGVAGLLVGQHGVRSGIARCAIEAGLGRAVGNAVGQAVSLAFDPGPTRQPPSDRSTTDCR